MNIFKFLVLCFVIIGLGSSAFGFEAEFVFVKGKVWLNRTQLEQPGTRPIKVGDQIKTGPASLAILKLKNESFQKSFKLNEASELHIDQLPDHQQHQTAIRLLKGTLFAALKKVDKAQAELNVTAKNVAMGVRGTEFFVALSDLEKKQDLWMCVHEGKVQVKHASNGQSVLVKAGEGILIEQGDKLSDPKAYAWTQGLNWNLDPAHGATENTIDMKAMYGDPLNFDYD